MQRQILITAAAFFICSCSASDAAVGVNPNSEKNPEATSTNSVANLARIDLGTLGGASSYGADVNGSDVVVGWSQTASGTEHAFRWSAGTGMVDLGTLPGHQSSRAIAIIDAQNSADAKILGVSINDNHSTPVVWNADGSISELPIPVTSPAERTIPTGFNARGDVVGWSAGVTFQQAWFWTAKDGKYDLAANLPGGTSESAASGVNASGRVVITAHAWDCRRDPSCWRTYIWSDATGYTSIGIPGTDQEVDVTGTALTDAGTVIGWASVDGGAHFAPYRWDKTSGFTFLPHYPGGDRGYAMAVNTVGSIVGADLDPSSGTFVATVWSPTGQIARLTPSDPSSSVAVAINNAGTIAGWTAISSSANHAAIWKPGSTGTRSSISVPTSMSARLSPASSACLKSNEAIKSRAALFDCVAKSDHKR